MENNAEILMKIWHYVQCAWHTPHWSTQIWCFCLPPSFYCPSWVSNLTNALVAKCELISAARYQTPVENLPRRAETVLFRSTSRNVLCMFELVLHHWNWTDYVRMCDLLHSHAVPVCLGRTLTLLSEQRAVSLTRGWASSVGSGRKWRRQWPTGRTASPTRPTTHQSEEQTWMTAGPWQEEVESVSTR